MIHWLHSRTKNFWRPECGNNNNFTQELCSNLPLYCQSKHNVELSSAHPGLMMNDNFWPNVSFHFFQMAGRDLVVIYRYNFESWLFSKTESDYNVGIDHSHPISFRCTLRVMRDQTQSNNITGASRNMASMQTSSKILRPMFVCTTTSTPTVASIQTIPKTIPIQT